MKNIKEYTTTELAVKYNKLRSDYIRFNMVNNKSIELKINLILNELVRREKENIDCKSGKYEFNLFQRLKRFFTSFNSNPLK